MGKNILFITNRVPYPPDKGDRIRTFHELGHLARSHRVYCACFASNALEWERARALQRWCKEIIVVPGRTAGLAVGAAMKWLRGQPMTQAAYHSRVMHRRLAELADRVNLDVVVVFSTLMAPYGRDIRAKRRVIDICDADSEKWFDYARAGGLLTSAFWRLEGRRARLEEWRAVRDFDASIFITSRERQLLSSDFAMEKTHVIANGVSLDAPITKRPSECGPIVGFLGTMDYRPNAEAVEWFVRAVWPQIYGRVPLAEFRIIGRNPTRGVRRLAGVPGVKVVGSVDHPIPHLLGCRVMVAPLHMARGIPNKVLEAMAAARPVVLTSQTADTLAAERGGDCLVADEPREFADHVENLLFHPDRADEIGLSARRFVERDHRWENLLHRFERIVNGETSKQRQFLPITQLGVTYQWSPLQLPPDFMLAPGGARTAKASSGAAQSSPAGS